MSNHLLNIISIIGKQYAKMKYASCGDIQQILKPSQSMSSEYLSIADEKSFCGIQQS